MKKVIMLAAAALFVLTAQAWAVPCYDCLGKTNPCDDVAFLCPSSEQVGCVPVDPCPVTFKICDCADADEFITGAEIGVKMTSLTEGVYWSNTATIDLVNGFWITDEQPVCPNSVTDRSWLMANDEKMGMANATQFLFYNAEDDTSIPGSVANTSEYNYDGEDCEVPDIAKFVEIKSVDAMGDPAGYIIDAMDEGLWWTFEIPPMVVDWAEAMANRGNWAQVKVELVLVEDVGICADCVTICECIVDVFRICAEGEEQEIYFPYVLNEIDLWASGIAISNVSTATPINEMVAEITVIDGDGVSQTATKSDFTTQVTAWMFEDLMAELGLTVPSGTVVVIVKGNFNIDGYQFNLFQADTTMFGAGVLARKPSLGM